jgi:hypothetical protein
MAMSPEELYLLLGTLIEEMPDLATGPITNDVNRWLGRAVALVQTSGDTANTIALQVASQNLNTAIRAQNAQTIAAIVHTALAKAELAAPAQVQGTFIAAGHTFDALAAVGKVARGAATSVLLVDPYSDERMVTDYVGLAPESVLVKILAETGKHKPTLKPAADRWKQQFGQARPLEVRLAPSGTLHDRLVIVDGNQAWVLGQSFNKLAERAHTSLVRMNKEAGDLKIAAYGSIWQSATPL